MQPCLQGHFPSCPTASYPNPPNHPPKNYCHGTPTSLLIPLSSYSPNAASQQSGWVWSASRWGRKDQGALFGPPVRVGKGPEAQGLCSWQTAFPWALALWLPESVWKSWRPACLPSCMRPVFPALLLPAVQVPCPLWVPWLPLSLPQLS